MPARLPDPRRMVILLAVLSLSFGPACRLTGSNGSPSPATSTVPGHGDAVRIAQIQGAGHRSPLVGQSVRDVYGVVIALAGQGFFLQDPQPDGDEATSEGIYVFMGERPRDIAAGDALRVSGRVQEYIPGGEATGNLSITEIVDARVTRVASGVALPGPARIGRGGRMPPDTVIEDDASGPVSQTGVFDPAADGLDFFESLEGMLVQVDAAVVIGPSDDFGEVVVLADGGADAGMRSARGALLMRPDDANPERIVLDDALVRLPDLSVGDHFTAPVVGVLDYDFGQFKVRVTTRPQVERAGLQAEVIAPAAGRLTVASYNVENLDAQDDPARFQMLASHIVDNLGAPDILALQEVQDNDGAVDSGVVSAGQTWALITAAVRAAGGPDYQVASIDPQNNADGGEPGGNIRVGFLYRADRGLRLADRPGGTPTLAAQVIGSGEDVALSINPGRIAPSDPAWTDSRKPLAVQFEVGGRSLFLINCHFASKGADQPDYGENQPPRRASEAQRLRQPRIVAGFASELLTADPHARVIVLGDLNDFQFSESLAAIEETGLTNLVETLPIEAQYNNIFAGNAQMLDQMLSSAALRVEQFQPLHLNAEFPASRRLSDHDPLVAAFSLD